MQKRLFSILRILLLTSLVLLVAFFTVLILFRPQEVSASLLKIGGRIIKKATSNVDWIAVIGGGCLLLFWLGIGLVASRERGSPQQETH